MTAPMTDAEIREALARAERARRHVNGLCIGTMKWRMRVPPQADDSDLVICNALDDSKRLAADLLAARAERDEARAAHESERRVYGEDVRINAARAETAETELAELRRWKDTHSVGSTLRTRAETAEARCAALGVTLNRVRIMTTDDGGPCWCACEPHQTACAEARALLSPPPSPEATPAEARCSYIYSREERCHLGASHDGPHRVDTNGGARLLVTLDEDGGPGTIAWAPTLPTIKPVEEDTAHEDEKVCDTCHGEPATDCGCAPEYCSPENHACPDCGGGA